MPAFFTTVPVEEVAVVVVGVGVSDPVVVDVGVDVALFVVLLLRGVEAGHSARTCKEFHAVLEVCLGVRTTGTVYNKC